MAKHLARDLEKLQHAILTMAAAVEEAVHTATRALQDRDPGRANGCIAGDAVIDKHENDVQEECLKVLALHQPVAGDLRRVASILLISTDLERMGDLAVGIAERALILARPAAAGVLVPDRLRDMTARATRMVRQSLDAFVQNDPDLARAVIRLDAEVDQDNASIIADLIHGMKQGGDHVEGALSLFSAVRHVERIADHATNIAEDVVYLVEGAQVRHTPGGRV